MLALDESNIDAGLLKLPQAKMALMSFKIAKYLSICTDIDMLQKVLAMKLHVINTSMYTYLMKWLADSIIRKMS